MKAAAFDYLRAGSIAEACAALDKAAGDGRIIAGGQTLVPLMVMRLARPALLVDINHVEALAGIDEAVDGGSVTIRAATRQADVLASDTVAAKVPLLARAIRFVGHGQTRNRGTVGGSLAHADPSAEIPLVALTLNAEITAARTGGERTIPAADFFTGPMTTALEAEECLTGVIFPVWHGNAVGDGFTEINVRRGDFAIVAAAAQIELAADGSCARLHVGIGGATPAPLRLTPVEDGLAGKPVNAETVAQACRDIGDLLDPESDIQASADYRRRTACVLAERAILAAAADAAEAGGKTP